MKPLAVIVLAAGEGKRMKSDLPKVCHPLQGKALLTYPVALAHSLQSRKIVVVLSGNPKKAKMTREVLKNHPAEQTLTYVIQKKPRGTGDAVSAAAPPFKNFSGTILILYGDVPLLSLALIRQFLRDHQSSKKVLSVLSVELNQPTGYGRILREDNGQFLKKIIEERDATPQEKTVREVNTGIYAVDAEFLFRSLKKIRPNNAQKEFYLTDIVGIAREEGEKVNLWAAPTESTHEFLGVNSRQDLLKLEEVLRSQHLQVLMAQGVVIHDPATVFIDCDCKVEPGAVIFPGVHLRGKTVILKNAHIGPYAVLTDVQVGEDATIKSFCVLEGARLEKKASVGPFAHLRPGSVLKENAKVGNFVEMKKTIMGEGAKASHLSYLGDAMVGKNANIGAGTITCNYDGFEKFKTVIGDGAFIGSDTQLVAPVRVGRGAIVGAGTTVTTDIPNDALALSRAPQINKSNWAKKFRALKKKK